MKIVCLYFRGRWNNSKCQLHTVMSSQFQTGIFESKLICISPGKAIIFSHLHVVYGCFCNALPQQNWTVSAESENHHPGGVTVGSWTECIWWLPNQTIKFPFCSVANRTRSGHQDLFPRFKAIDKMYHPVPACRDPLHLLPQAQPDDAGERGIQS